MMQVLLEAEYWANGHLFCAPTRILSASDTYSYIRILDW